MFCHRLRFGDCRHSSAPESFADFQDYYLQSIRLREFGSLVRTLGVDNVILLLDSGAKEVILAMNSESPED